MERRFRLSGLISFYHPRSVKEISMKSKILTNKVKGDQLQVRPPEVQQFGPYFILYSELRPFFTKNWIF